MTFFFVNLYILALNDLVSNQLLMPPGAAAVMAGWALASSSQSLLFFLPYPMYARGSGVRFTSSFGPIPVARNVSSKIRPAVNSFRSDGGIRRAPPGALAEYFGTMLKRPISITETAVCFTPAWIGVGRSQSHINERW
jgi:hypothetical protein